MRIFLFSAVALVALAPSASAAPATSAYDASVRESQAQVVKAEASGDPVVIATTRAKLKAAQATAWGARHPAPQPVPDQVAAATPR